MTIVFMILAAWLLVSLPFAMIIGKACAHPDGRELAAELAEEFDAAHAA